MVARRLGSLLVLTLGACAPATLEAARTPCEVFPDRDEAAQARFFDSFVPAKPLASDRLSLRVKGAHRFERHDLSECGYRVLLEAPSTVETTGGVLTLPSGASIWVGPPHLGIRVRAPSKAGPVLFRGLRVTDVRLRSTELVVGYPSSMTTHLRRLTFDEVYRSGGAAWTGPTDFGPGGTIAGGSLAAPLVIEGTEIPAGASVRGYFGDWRRGVTAYVADEPSGGVTVHSWVLDSDVWIHGVSRDQAPGTLTVRVGERVRTWTGALEFRGAEHLLTPSGGPIARLRTARSRVGTEALSLRIEYRRPRKVGKVACSTIFWDFAQGHASCASQQGTKWVEVALDPPPAW